MLSGAFPVKVKAIRILHVNRALSVALSTASGFMSAKMKARRATAIAVHISSRVPAALRRSPKPYQILSVVLLFPPHYSPVHSFMIVYILARETHLSAILFLCVCCVFTFLAHDSNCGWLDGVY